MKVFIAASAKNVGSRFESVAVDVSTILAKSGHKLLFGGADTGLMGKCFFTFKYEGGKVKAVADVRDAEVANSLETNACEIVANTFDRTKNLYREADLIVALPGGVGTLAEILSIMDEIRTRKSSKEIILINYDDYYTNFLNYLSEMHKKGFINESDLRLITVVNNINNFKKYIEDMEEI